MVGNRQVRDCVAVLQGNEVGAELEGLVELVEGLSFMGVFEGEIDQVVSPIVFDQEGSILEDLEERN